MKPNLSAEHSSGADAGSGVAQARLALVALAGLLGGCAREAVPDYPHVNLGGIVTVDGTPIAEGLITFTSPDGRIVVSNIRGGRYFGEEVPLGKVRVVVTASRETGRMLVVDGYPSPEIQNLVPPKYRGGFTLNITRNAPRVDFPMRSDHGP
jgi:hypothetical protein